MVAYSGGGEITHGSQLTPSMVGSDPEASLTPSGPITATVNGATYNNLAINGRVVIQANNVTFNNCYIFGVSDTGGTGRLVFNDFGSPYTNAQFNNCTFDGEDSCRLAAGYHDIHLYRCLTMRCKLDFQMYLNASFVESYAYDHFVLNDGDHREVILCNSGTNIHIVRSHMTYENFADVSAVVSFYGDSPGMIDSSCVDNWIDGGGQFSIYAGVPGLTTNVQVTGNIFGRTIHRLGGESGLIASKGSGGTYTWSNNRWGPWGPFNTGSDPAEGTLIP